jgi:hypothetical protein
MEFGIWDIKVSIKVSMFQWDKKLESNIKGCRFSNGFWSLRKKFMPS